MVEVKLSHREVRSGNTLLLCSVAGAVVCIVGGLWLGWELKDAYWVNRSGALVVALGGLVVLVEFSREERMRAAERLISRESASSSMKEAYIRARAHRLRIEPLAIGIILALTGEVLHGFGDILVGAVFSGLTASGH